MPDVAIVRAQQSPAGSDAELRQAVQVTSKRLYFYIEGSPSTVNNALLERLAGAFDVVAVEKPCLDLVPLVTNAGWSTDKIAGLQDLQAVVCSQDSEAGAQTWSNELNDVRPGNLTRLTVFKSTSQQQQGALLGGQDEEQSHVTTLQARDDLQFEHVAVGGTFDRLHAGHRILLAAVALVSTQAVYIGITSDKLLVNKQHHQLLEPYDKRRAAAISYMQAVRPSLTISGGALTDPQEPTAAATDPRMQALVVSHETVPGAEAINEDRKRRGFRPLSIIVVDIVGKGSKELSGEKLSSTALRANDAGKLGRPHL